MFIPSLLMLLGSTAAAITIPLDLGTRRTQATGTEHELIERQWAGKCTIGMDFENQYNWNSYIVGSDGRQTNNQASKSDYGSTGVKVEGRGSYGGASGGDYFIVGYTGRGFEPFWSCSVTFNGVTFDVASAPAGTCDFYNPRTKHGVSDSKSFSCRGHMLTLCSVVADLIVFRLDIVLAAPDIWRSNIQNWMVYHLSNRLILLGHISSVSFALLTTALEYISLSKVARNQALRTIPSASPRNPPSSFPM
jgi:uncharacterized membrane protein